MPMSRQPSKDTSRWRVVFVGAATFLTLLAAPARQARAEVIHVEGFNGDGFSYGTLGRGTFDGPLGTAFWESVLNDLTV